MHEEQEEKKVGKAAEPTGEELEFIYSRLERMSDSAILEEMQDTEFPLRTKRFIKRRRKEFSAAKRVLEIQIQKESDPITAKRKEEHFDRLADITAQLLANNLENVEETPSQKDPTDPFKYTIWDGGAGVGITHDLLVSGLRGNIERTQHQFSDWDFGYFLYHLAAEIPEIESRGFSSVVEEKPYKLIETLRVLVRRKTFKGTCPVCKDWQ